MSVEKEAAFLGSLARYAKHRLRVAHHDIKKAAPYIRQSGEAGSYAFHRQIVDGLAKADAFGANTAAKGLKKIDQGLTAADTGLGSLMRGKSKSGLWHDMWTSKDKVQVHPAGNGSSKMIPGKGPEGSPVYYKEIERPSVIKPLAATGAFATGILAQMKGTELLDKLRTKPQEQY